MERYRTPRNYSLDRASIADGGGLLLRRIPRRLSFWDGDPSAQANEYIVSLPGRVLDVPRWILLEVLAVYMGVGAWIRNAREQLLLRCRVCVGLVTDPFS